ncbi:RCC1 domain-containing protein, partial [Desulfosporosinus shakirovi]|uniref:RCC1 domain-containing protein n=1 Tax=Desulfosporosinus shakirovi TaxID=2885154 RepID=UPI0037BE4577|nr:hypothetical protein [Desulfosporosinus sp. SRJS8]
MGKIKNFIKKFIVLVIVILIPLILLLANPGNPVYASVNPDPSIAGGSSHTIALKSDGTVWSWGDNTYGQLGDGTGITRYTPVEVQGLSSKTITAIAAGDNSSYFLASDGTVWSVGYNNYGQLGDGTTTSRNLPVEVQGLSGKTITAIAAGINSAYFLAIDGTVWSVGLNTNGQLGDGTTTSRSFPVQVQGLSSKTITAVAGGQYTAYFLASDGTVWSVGYNYYGQLGDGTTTRKTQPVQVQGLSGKTVTTVAAGYNSAYFLASDGTVWSVGYNNNGQLSDGTTTNKSVPVQVQGLSSM